MQFEIKRTITNEFSEDNLKVDLNYLEDFISDNLKEINYGSSVLKYFWGFELFRYDSGFSEFFRNEIESWKHSVKWFITNSNFDWNVVKDLDERQTLELIKEQMLLSIGRIEKMKRKPKDFDYKKLMNDLNTMLCDYIENRFTNKVQ